MEDKRKLVIVLVVVGIIVALVIVGFIQQRSQSAANAAALAAQNAANAQPAQPPTDAERAAASNALSVVTNPQDDRVRIGGRLPFGVPAGSAETEAGKLASANFTASASDKGTLEELAPQDGKVWVMIQMEPSNKKSILGKSITRALEVVQPVLQDSQGQFYEPCGLLYQDMNSKIVIIDPINIVRGLSQAPRLEESRTDQSLWLVFLMPPGTEVRSFWLGKKMMVEWVPVVPVK